MTVTSMPQPTLHAQRVPGPAEEVILGVDTHKDVHVAAVITTLVTCPGLPQAAAPYARPQPVPTGFRDARRPRGRLTDGRREPPPKQQ